ncbi:MAG: 1-acyl-sn-glycerol-3-phosphate acyltransferase, partial [Elusimicrobia bacterium]|nr:1-acyl-sn-glycerol-3-phosphate acyltransferase [Elusimicrobiota bacterium]
KGGSDAPPSAPKRELSAEEAEWASRSEVARALELVREAAKSKPERVHPKDNIELDLGLDSVERVELVGKLAREAGAAVPDLSKVQAFTARELVDAVLALKGSGAAAAGWETLLKEDPKDEEALGITRSRPLADLLWPLAFGLLRLAAKVLYRLEVKGLERLPKEGPFLLCPNHQSFLDGPMLLAALPRSIFKRSFYVGTSDIFGQGIMRSIARSLRLIPIDPDANMTQAMAAGAYGLRRGKVLVLFPEGERSIDGTPKRFKKGAAILSSHLKVPVVPVGLAGFAEAWPRAGKLKLSGRLRLEFGAPVAPPSGESGDPVYAAHTAVLRERIVALWTGLCA